MCRSVPDAQIPLSRLPTRIRGVELASWSRSEIRACHPHTVRRRARSVVRLARRGRDRVTCGTDASPRTAAGRPAGDDGGRYTASRPQIPPARPHHPSGFGDPSRASRSGTAIRADLRVVSHVPHVVLRRSLAAGIHPRRLAAFAVTTVTGVRSLHSRHRATVVTVAATADHGRESQHEASATGPIAIVRAVENRESPRARRFLPRFSPVAWRAWLI